MSQRVSCRVVELKNNAYEGDVRLELFKSISNKFPI